MTVTSEPSGPPSDFTPPTGNPHIVQIPHRLYKAAQQAASDGLRTYASARDDERRTAAISLGAAAEYLGRAAVAFHDPLLLAARDHVPSLVALSQANAASPLDSRTLRTVESHVLWALLSKLHPRYAPHAPSRGGTENPSPTTLVMAARNAAAHMAMVDEKHLEGAARALVIIVKSLHPIGEKTEVDFWPMSLQPTVAALEDQTISATRLRYQAKLTYARSQHERLLAGMNPEEQERTQTMLESRVLPVITHERHEDVEQACPACGRRGIATYLVEEGDPEGGWFEAGDDSWDYAGWTRPLSFVASIFRCPVCGLELRPAEFATAGLASALEDVYEEIQDPYADWEPDIDEIRGR